MPHGHISQSYSLGKHGGHDSGCYPADFIVVPVKNRISISWDPSFIHLKSDQLPFGALLFFFGQCLTVHKILGEFGDPSQTRFQGGRGVIDIVAVKAISHLQPQGVPSGQAYRFYTEIYSCFQHFVPYLMDLGVFAVYLKAARTGIAGSGNNHMVYPRKVPHHKIVEPNGGKID